MRLEQFWMSSSVSRTRCTRLEATFSNRSLFSLFAIYSIVYWFSAANICINNIYATKYALKKEIQLLLTEDLTELKPINFHTNWETIESKKYGIKNCVTNIDKDTGYIYFCKEKMDNYAHYYVVDTMYSNERMYVVQKAYDDTNNIPKILREVKVNRFIHGFKG